MSYDLDGKLVVAVASSALFDLRESDHVFRTKGEEAYRQFQRENEERILKPGVAFPLIKRLLSFHDEQHGLVEVLLFSRNDPDTGLRVFKSIEHYDLPITRAVFVAGRNPFEYMTAFHASLFLSGNQDDVREAIANGLPAGYVEETEYVDDDDEELRIAFDFDGVIADDSSEQVFTEVDNLDQYQQHEKIHAREALPEGPLYRFLAQLSKIQKQELQKQQVNESYKPKIRIALCTARNAPAYERVVTTLRTWDIRVDEAFFLGGIEKKRVLEIYKPHIFFDDQRTHIEGVSKHFPSVHIPYGVANRVKNEE